MSCRKKIDSKIWNEWADYTQTMESEVRNLRQEVSRTQDSLRAATRRCRELVRELDGLNVAREHERSLRDQQLSRLLRALLVLESRLKHEQKSIRQLLCDKDAVIRTQQLEIARLRRYAKNNFLDGKVGDAAAGQQHVVSEKEAETLMPSLESQDFQEQQHESGLSKDIQKLKCEIMTKLNEGLDENGSPSNIRKTHSFAGSDISKASLTSSENTDASIITTTTEGSPSLLSTEGFCEGESTDVSPGSTLNKSSNRCTPTLIVTTDSETELTTVIESQKSIARSESKDDGMDCNYVSDEDEQIMDEPIYENDVRNNIKAATKPTKEDCSNNNVQVTITRLDAEHNLDESSGNWYSDPDEDRLNDELLRHSVYRPNSNHNSVLECVNQILLRDMEDEENILSVPRRFKHRGKIVRFQPARLSDIESVGSEMERRNSEEPGQTVTAMPVTITTDETEIDEGENDNEETPSTIDGYDATNSEEEYGLRIAPALDPESGLEEDVDETKARPIVIIEPVDEPRNHSNITRSLAKETRNQSSPASARMERIDEKTSLQLSRNLDYEEIESLPDISTVAPKVPPALPPKPQLSHNSLILLPRKKIPSPSFLIDESSRKKQQQQQQQKQQTIEPAGVIGITSTGKPPIVTSSVRSLKFDSIQPQQQQQQQQQPKNKANDNNDTSFWKNRFNNVRSSFQIRQQNTGSNDSSNETSPRTSPDSGADHQTKVTNIVKQFEEFKIEGDKELLLLLEAPKKSNQPTAELDNDDIKENFEEFNLDECDLSDEPDRLEAPDGSETYVAQLVNVTLSTTPAANDKNLENNNTTTTSNGTTQLNGNVGNYDSFLEATGLSTKSILTPSRLLSNHKSMLKPKDIKYKSKIKASAVMERHGITMSTAAGNGLGGSGASTTTLTKHWTGPFV